LLGRGQNAKCLTGVVSIQAAHNRRKTADAGVEGERLSDTPDQRLAFGRALSDCLLNSLGRIFRRYGSDQIALRVGGKISQIWGAPAILGGRRRAESSGNLDLKATPLELERLASILDDGHDQSALRTATAEIEREAASVLTVDILKNLRRAQRNVAGRSHRVRKIGTL
jgi:hypothetical protein